MALQISFRKGRRNQGKAAYCVDMRSLRGGKERFFKTKEAAAQFITMINKELVIDDTNSWQWPVSKLQKAYLIESEKQAREGDITLSTLEERLRHIKVFVSLQINGKLVCDLLVRTITTGQIQFQLMDQLKKKRTKKTVQGYVGTIYKMLEFGIKLGCRETNPVISVDSKGDPAKPARVFISENIQPHIIEKIISEMDLVWQLITTFAANTGLRQGELRVLTWDDILWDRNKVNVNKAHKKHVGVGATKSEAGKRKVPLPKDLKKALQEYYIFVGRPAGSTLIFPHKKPKPRWVTKHSLPDLYHEKFLRQGQFRDVIIKACDAAGVERIRWHDLRHFNASMLLKKHSNDMWEVSKRLGHAQLSTTQNIYGHFIEDIKDEEEEDILTIQPMSAMFKEQAF